MENIQMHARRNDPATSKEAAAEASENNSEIVEKLLKIVRDSEAGKTAIEMNTAHGIPAQTSSTTMSRMEKEGLIELSGFSRKNQLTKRFGNVYVCPNQPEQIKKLQGICDFMPQHVRKNQEGVKITFKAYGVVVHTTGCEPYVYKVCTNMADAQHAKSMAIKYEKLGSRAEIIKFQKTQTIKGEQ